MGDSGDRELRGIGKNRYMLRKLRTSRNPGGIGRLDDSGDFSKSPESPNLPNFPISRILRGSKRFSLSATYNDFPQSQEPPNLPNLPNLPIPFNLPNLPDLPISRISQSSESPKPLISEFVGFPGVPTPACPGLPSP